MAVPSDSVQDYVQDYVLQYVCEKYGIKRSAIGDTHYNSVKDQYGVAFSPPKPSATVIAAARMVKEHFDDPLRSEVIRAAVPNLAADIDILLTQIFARERQVVWVDGHLARTRRLS